MKNKTHIISRFVLLLIVFFFQSSPIISRFEVGGVTPNILFVILFVYALFLKDTEVVAYTVIFGTLADLLFGKIYGITTLLLLLFVCTYIFLNKYIYTESIWVVFLYCLFASWLYETLMLFINSAIWQETVLSLEVMRLVTIKCVYGSLICLPVFCIARKMHRLKQEVRIDG
ncbi:MAG: rod shape-determining protein MreD [Clostridia bacterium]|nr:rod shape-determining protein MreD [Clostridia bacterium]